MERAKAKKRMFSLILVFVMMFSWIPWGSIVYADTIDSSVESDEAVEQSDVEIEVEKDAVTEDTLEDSVESDETAEQSDVEIEVEKDAVTEDTLEDSVESDETAEQSDVEIEVKKITVTEDAFVGSWSGDQKANFGSKNYLRVAYGEDSAGLLGTESGGDNKVTYLKFSLSSIQSDEFEKAKLNLTLLGVRNEKAVGQDVKILVGAAANEWTEGAIAWNNKPELITKETNLKKSEVFVPGNVWNNNPDNITVPDGTLVTVDITDFIRDAVNQKEEFLTLAVNIDNSNSVMTGADANRIFFVSKEGAGKYQNASEMAPSLLLTRAPAKGEKVLDRIEVTAPTKTKYEKGDALDLTGMTIQAVYANADAEDLSADAEGVAITGFDSKTSGRKTVTVTYQGKTAAFTVAVVEHYTGFVPNAQWLDTDGNMIQAHGGGVLWDDKSGKYYWYGENKAEANISEGAVEAIGVSCYSSADLYNWDYEGMALPVFNNPAFLGGNYTNDTPLYLAESSDEYQKAKKAGVKVSPYDTLEKYNSEETIQNLNALYKDTDAAAKKNLYDMLNWNCVVERPKVIYNEGTEKYVMWFHRDGEGAGKYELAQAAVAVSDSTAGPFKLIDSKRPNGYMSRDMTLFKDEDGTAYLIHSSENNQVLYITELDANYTGVTGRYSRNYVYGTGEPWAREAPAVFKYEGVYYLISSGCTGWDPNPMGYSVTQDLTEGMSTDGGNGPFQFENNKKLPNPCTGTGADTTFGGQTAYVLPVQGSEGRFIYMGDKWNKNDLRDSRYQWLPIEVDSESRTLTIPWMEKWNLESLESIKDWKKLDDAVEEVEYRCAAKYTTETWKKVQDAYDAAKSLDRNTASREKIQQAAEKITDALSGLINVKVETKNFDLKGKKIRADSQETTGAQNQAEKAIDGKDDTFWHTSWDSKNDPLPHDITIDLGASVENLYELRFLPRQDKDSNGIITEYRILTSNSGKDLEALENNDFTEVWHGKWKDDKTEKSAVFLSDGPVKYLRLKALAGHDGYASAAEIKLNVKKGPEDLDLAALSKAVAEAE